MANTTKLQLIIEAAANVDRAFGDLKQHLKDAQGETDKLRSKSADLTSDIKRLAASFITLAAAITTIKSGISYLAQIETATLGIGSAFMVGGKYIDETSKKALSAQDALNAAQGDAKEIVEELKYANLQTIATLDELIQAYQVTLPVALAKGFNREQVKEFTVAMVQAAGAIGLPMNQLAEETRSILTEAINPRTSRIATVLGLRNEDIRQYEGNAQELFNFLMDRLSAYRTAGVESQKTWAGLLSNTKDIVQQALGKVVEPLFDTIKSELQKTADKIVILDEKTKTIKWNPEFLKGVESFRGGIQSIIAEVYRLGMLLDKIGGSFTTISSAWHGIRATMLEKEIAKEETRLFPRDERIKELRQLLQEQRALEEAALKSNDQYRERYKQSEKALQDMVMSSMGWKTGTPDIDQQMRKAAGEGKKLFEQMQINIGNPEEGTQQLLRYYREIESKKPALWSGNPAKEDEALKKLREKWADAARDLDATLAAAGQDELDKKLIEIGKKYEVLREKAKDLPGEEKIGAETKISAAREAEENEVIDKWYKEYLTKQVKASEAYLAQEDATNKSIQRGTKETTEDVKKAYQERQAAREAEISRQLAELDIAEVSGTAHRETLTERIRLTEELQHSQEDYLLTIDRLKDPTGWNTIQNQIITTRKTLLQLKTEQEAAVGVFSAGWEKGLTEYLNNVQSAFDSGKQMAAETAAAMESSFSDIFFDGLQGKFKSFSDYLRSFINSLQRSVANILSQQATAGIQSGLQSLFGGTTYYDSALGQTVTASAGSIIPTHHSGGVVGASPAFYRIVPNISEFIPRRHGGGLAPDERMVINKVGERYVTEEQNEWLSSVARAAAGGGSSSAKSMNLNLNYTEQIMAMDSASFKEYSRRNAGSIADAFLMMLRDNKIRAELKKLLS